MNVIQDTLTAHYKPNSTTYLSPKDYNISDLQFSLCVDFYSNLNLALPPILFYFLYALPETLKFTQKHYLILCQGHRASL